MNTFFPKMRVALLMSFLCLAANVFANADRHAAAGVLDKKISLSMSNKGLKNVLAKIEQAAAVKFAYATQTIPLNNKVSIDVKNQRLGDVLEVLLSPYNVNYEAIGNQIIIQKDGMKVVIDTRAVQTGAFKKVTGAVKTADGASIPGVTVTVKGTAKGTVTNADGRFELDAEEGATLVFTAIGFATQEVVVGSGVVYDVTLLESQKELSEVVVTALGVRKEKRALGFSVTEVKGAELAQTNEVNPINALQGKAPGINIDQGSGGLFGNSRILIRGNSTLGINNQPIFVIDGVIMDNDAFDGKGRDFGNDLKNLNMEEFESVSILKGSAAAALYGARAINGVVLITTKKGRNRKGWGVSVSQSINIQDPYAGPDFQNEFGGGTVGAFFTDTRDPGYRPQDAWNTKVFPTNSNGEPYIDPQKNRELENWGPRFSNQRVLNYDGTWTEYKAAPNNYLDAFQTGVGYLTSVAVDGATDKSSFRLSYSRNDAEGINLRNKMMKNAFSLRATHNLTSFISLDAGADYTTLQGENPPQLGLNNFIWIFPRNYDTKYWMQRSKYTSQLGGVPKVYDANETNFVPGADYWFRIFENNYTQDEQMFRGRLTINATLTKWLRMQLEGNFSNIAIKNESKELGQGYNFTGSDNTSGGFYSLSHSLKKAYFLKWMGLVTKQLTKDLSLNGYVGGETQRYTQTYNQSQTDGGLVFPGNYFLGNSQKPQISNGGFRPRKTINSIYASADLAYKDMLFMQATWRGDWSSALTYTDGTGNNFYNYPAVSLSWIFTETFKLPSFISFGKLRGNIAYLGGDLDPFQLNPGFKLRGFTQVLNGNIPMLTFVDNNGASFMVDKDIKPLRKRAIEGGLDIRFLNDRLGLDATIYRDNTRNQAINIQAAAESGVNNLLINAGDIQNSGVELALTATPVKTKSFDWNTTLTFTRNRNKIVELYQDREYFPLDAESGGANDLIPYAKVGGTYGVIRTRIASKRYQAVDGSGKPVDHPNNGMVVLDWRSDARAAFPKRSNEWMDVGDINPDFRASWDNTFRYKNISLNVLFDAKIGGDMVMHTLRYGMHTGIFKSSLQGRDKDHGGIEWTSGYDNRTYDDGILPEGVFDNGQTITQPNGTSVDVSGMTFREAYEKGYVEPTHLPQFMYRYGSFSTAVGDYWVVKNSWISLRQLALNYTLPTAVASKLHLNNLGVSLIGRDLFYLYNSLPNNINPASNNSNRTSLNKEEGFVPPMTRSFVFTIRAGF
ncbi:SusC/RagA family TonB-linked outer membrane protein [Chitinophaga sp. GCM10012297]|uniref:SusC/RagA family TonB-linked outer membrane protein n=1 Tax=Chitinophaga chungangae TaxID=2821488 RepID=A0ABS3YH32_9BACT|nr:SusC/RagA family TonB-linked outer membrane protein [Chitinophaga chungangae]MBO9153760.1 SusC/RagA family TonB-linked outer membrane protein [Chitinophaga chungangae]